MSETDPPDPRPDPPTSDPEAAPAPPGKIGGTGPLGPSAVGAMAELLRASGVDDATVADADRNGHLALLVIERLVLADPANHDLRDMTASTALSPELITRVWRSLGFVEPRPGDHIFTDVDVDLLRTIGRLLEMGAIDDELVLQMARVIGSSMSRVAAALVDAIEPTDDAHAEDRAEGLLATALPGSDDDRDDEFAAVAPVLFPTLLRVMEFVWRRHVQAEARARISREQSGADPDHMVVGFADLVGFTALSQQIGSHELAAVVERFETIAYDTITGLGGRVVKMIGDEVMFAVPHERPAAEIALSLSRTYRDDDELSDVRVGLACGPVLQREADLFGPVVNMASRIVRIAFPGTVVCAGGVHDSLASDVEYSWKSIGPRNLKDIGRTPLYVLRRADDEVPPRNSRQVAEARRAERREARVTEMEERRERRRKRSK